MNVQCRYMFPNINCFNACQAITMWCFKVLSAMWTDRCCSRNKLSPHKSCWCKTFFTFLPRFHDKVILEEELNALRCADNHCNWRRPIAGLWLMITHAQTGQQLRSVLKIISLTISNSSSCVWFRKCLLSTPYLSPIFGYNEFRLEQANHWEVNIEKKDIFVRKPLTIHGISSFFGVSTRDDVGT